MKAITPAPHEFSANLLFAEHGLAPFFAFDSVVKEGGGSMSAEFVVDGERWVGTLSYQSSNIVHPGERTPGGTDWNLTPDDDTDPTTLRREYRLKVARHEDEDHLGKQSFVAHIAPRWPDMKGLTNSGSLSDISPPDGFGEGINVDLKGSNVEFARYPDLFRRASIAVGLAGKYFEEIHEFSNIQDAERYVRVHEEDSGPVHARAGPIASMGHLLENDREGYRKVVQNDDDGHGRNRPGYYHTVTLGPRRIREAFPDHKLPKEVKHYYAKEAETKPENHPLAHPKIGSSLQASRLDHGDTVHWSDLDRLERELDQTVLSVLADAGLDVAPSAEGVFVEDAYFEPNVDHSGPDPIGLGLTRIEQTQESIVVRHLANGLSPVQEESLTQLVTDGSEVSPKEIADAIGRHVESVRRRLRDMEDLVDREYGRVSLRSEYVAEMVHEAVAEARDGYRRAVETTEKAVQAAERGLDETMSSFIAWAARHGVDVNDARDAQMRLRFDGSQSASEAEKAVREGFKVWTAAGMPEERYRQAQVRFPGGQFGTAWRFLATE